MKDARISTAFPSHPKTKKLARRLGPAGVLGCVYLFLWAAANRSDGSLSGMTDEDIELAVDWSGEPGAFVAAAAEVGYLDGPECERCIHDWEEHNPWAFGADARSEKSRWAALCKQHGRQEAARMMPEYAERIRLASHPQASSVPVAVPESASGTPLAETGSAPSPSPSPSPEDQKQSLSKPSASDRAERLAQVTEDAIETFNAAPFVKSQGGNVPNVSAIGRDKRRQQVNRCSQTARDIVRVLGLPGVNRDFWEAYWQTVDADPFCSGRQAGTGAHANWVPDFEYLTRPGTMAKLFDKAAS